MSKTEINSTTVERSLPGSSDERYVDGCIERALTNDRSALAELFELYRPRLKRMVHLRMDRRLQTRVDASDIVQEAFIDASRQLEDYSSDPKIEFFLWLRLLTGQRLSQVHRTHLATQKRKAAREVSIERQVIPGATTVCLASDLFDKLTTVSSHVMRVELQSKLQEVLDEMEEMDREVLALKHFEELTNAQIGQVLGISESAASKRYIRALRRLKQSTNKIPGFHD